MQVLDTVLCSNCNSQILQKCEMIHQRVCNNSKILIKQEKQKGFFSKLFGSSRQEKIQQDEAMIPCTECGDSFPFSAFAVHQQECVGHQLTKCHQCQILFPTFLFDEHLQVCTSPKLQSLFNPVSNNKNGLQFKISATNYPQTKKVENKHEALGFKKEDILHEDSDDSEDSEDEVLDAMIAQLARRQIHNQKLTDTPLTSQQLNKLQSPKLTNAQECSICCCEMMKKAKHIRLNCRHTFHKRCINSWLGKNPLCPMCRQHALKQ